MTRNLLKLFVVLVVAFAFLATTGCKQETKKEEKKTEEKKIEEKKEAAVEEKTEELKKAETKVEEKKEELTKAVDEQLGGDVKEKFAKAYKEMFCLAKKEQDPQKLAAAQMEIYKKYGFTDPSAYTQMMTDVSKDMEFLQKLQQEAIAECQ